MEKWLELIILAGKVIWVQLQTGINPIVELIESSMNSFWFVFVLTVITGTIILEVLYKAITFYQAHNFIHRKMVREPASDIEFSLFIKTLWHTDRSKGLVANAKAAKSRYLQFNGQERLVIQNSLQQRLRFLRNNQPLFLLAAIFAGLLSSIAANVLPINTVSFTGESILKTVLFLLTWLFIMQSKYVSMKKQTYYHLAWMQETNRTAAVELNQEEDAPVSFNESNPTY
ncbi:hypothetical protein [Fictibacillus phosphorivorans]|uniref:hypothetical protein n=1 Tax=Fictibacillus phosphorivorans TaxID=1221500 RepID=UPI00204019A4|nr:hypothetical protein [Fictibacillus phosphorivorans]MCM3718036.1 hypothetical protein [Fictibacillus phosphorivorans]MCM3775485.1 hypothetical protein [Fictibacillus phosphorivorans]